MSLSLVPNMRWKYGGKVSWSWIMIKDYMLMSVQSDRFRICDLKSGISEILEPLQL